VTRRTHRAFLALLLAVSSAGCGSLPGWLARDGADRSREPVVAVRKQAWEQRLGGREAAKPHLKARLGHWPTRLVVDRRELPADDRAFLERLARDTWRGLEAMADLGTGLPIDHLRFPNGSLEPGDVEFGDYTTTTNIGLYLAAIVGAHELGLIGDASAVARLTRVLATLGRLETHRGFYYNFYDVISLERTSDFVSFVDSSWLLAGLIVVRTAFPELAAECAELIRTRDLRFYYDRKRHLMSHGYDVSRRRSSLYHYGALYTEARLGSLLAIGRGEAPAQHWFEMVRVFPPAPERPATSTVREHEGAGRYLVWNDIRYVPSWGGSMFEALMPSLFLDEQRFAPDSLGANDRAHVEGQRRYATEVLGYPVWGMSPCMMPSGRYGEFGAPVLGVRGYPAGMVTPHASALALAVDPDAATRNLRELVRRYDIYGDFGLYDSVDPRTGTVAHAYLSLDQAMTFLALVNHLDNRVVQKLFASDPIVQRALPVIRGERFFD
jgi:hypothetical protein